MTNDTVKLNIIYLRDAHSHECVISVFTEYGYLMHCHDRDTSDSYRVKCHSCYTHTAVTYLASEIWLATETHTHTHTHTPHAHTHTHTHTHTFFHKVCSRKRLFRNTRIPDVLLMKFVWAHLCSTWPARFVNLKEMFYFVGPIRNLPMGNSGHFPQGKPAATQSRYPSLINL